jgi:hypothetical protein
MDSFPHFINAIRDSLLMGHKSSGFAGAFALFCKSVPLLFKELINSSEVAKEALGVLLNEELLGINVSNGKTLIIRFLKYKACRLEIKEILNNIPLYDLSHSRDIIHFFIEFLQPVYNTKIGIVEACVHIFSVDVDASQRQQENMRLLSILFYFTRTRILGGNCDAYIVTYFIIYVTEILKNEELGKECFPPFMFFCDSIKKLMGSTYVDDVVEDLICINTIRQDVENLGNHVCELYSRK